MQISELQSLKKQSRGSKTEKQLTGCPVDKGSWGVTDRGRGLGLTYVHELMLWQMCPNQATDSTHGQGKQ